MTDKFYDSMIYMVLVLAMISLIFTFYVIIKPIETNNGIQVTGLVVNSIKMGFTPFDVQLAKGFMDKNYDGMCDFCGMRIEDCIASGMMQCTMDPNAKIGLLRSNHKHADFKLFINNNPINFVNKQNYMRSMMLHLDENLNPEDSSGVLHMHATGVPLWLFFRSIEFKLPSSIKIYINGKLNSNGLDYVFKDKDKLLLTDANDEFLIRQQLESVTNYARDHNDKA